MQLIPAIDLRAGRCVRLEQGDFGSETGYASPKDVLRRYRRLGARWVHVVDLDGAREGRRVNHAVIASLAAFFLPHLQAGGGVRCASDIENLLNAGVARVVIGSAALHQPAEVTTWLQRFGRQRICLAFDVRSAPGTEPRVCTQAWQVESSVTLWQALTRYPVGSIQHVLCTDIARDGMLSGPNLELYRSAVARFPGIAWQASGGVRSAADLAALRTIGVTATVSGKALLEERIRPQELRSFWR